MTGHLLKRRSLSSGILLASICLLCGADKPAADKPAAARPVEENGLNALIALRLAAIIRGPTGLHPVPARIAAARTLGHMGFEARAAVPELIRVLEQPWRHYPLALDEAIVAALGQIGGPARPAIPALVGNVGRDRDLDRAVAEAVAAILKTDSAPSSVEELIRSLSDPVPGERLSAAKKLSALGVDARPAAGALAAALADPDADVRRAALKALLVIDPRAAPLQALLAVHIRDLTDADEAVRLAAAKALARQGPTARFALPALRAAARSDPDEDVRKVAGDAVARIEGRGGP